MKIYRFTRKELKQKKASDFKHNDVIYVSIYIIYIRYKSKENSSIYSTPSLCSFHERRDFKPCGCTPGVDRPYYIDDFLGR
ncbi:MAG: hypothetical protein KAQ99_08815 [Candidatus Aureabacteria bacterium]|nr:hypothetical protein [Candidatus Auribacterota bacterium]